MMFYSTVLLHNHADSVQIATLGENILPAAAPAAFDLDGREVHAGRIEAVRRLCARLFSALLRREIVRINKAVGLFKIPCCTGHTARARRNADVRRKMNGLAGFHPHTAAAAREEFYNRLQSAPAGVIGRDEGLAFANLVDRGGRGLRPLLDPCRHIKQRLMQDAQIIDLMLQVVQMARPVVMDAVVIVIQAEALRRLLLPQRLFNQFSVPVAVPAKGALIQEAAQRYHLAVNPAGLHRAAAALLELLAQHTDPSVITRFKKEAYVRRFYHLIYDALDEDPFMDAQELIRRFLPGAGKTTAYRMFHDYVHMSVSQYLSHVRMNKARDLLKETGLSVKEISEKAGFNDYNYFCRVFRRENGMSATQYRDSHRFSIEEKE